VKKTWWAKPNKTMNMGKRQKEVFRWATHTHKICQNVQTFVRGRV
jgi:hypothetical protein